ncbi:MAG: ATP-binding protein [Lachnospiraceae bacterium]|nr:ATP-binding protein [Lachnospiraceae bacterium]
MYERIGRWLELITAVISGCCVKYFFGSLADRGSRGADHRDTDGGGGERRSTGGGNVNPRSMNWRGAAAALLYGGWELLCGSALLPEGGLLSLLPENGFWSLLSREGVRVLLIPGAAALLLFLTARLLYRQTSAMAAFMAVSFLAVREISAYLVHVVAMAGDGLNTFLLWAAERVETLGEEEVTGIVRNAAIVVQLALYAALWTILVLSLRRLVRSFREGELGLHDRETMLLMLPGLMGLAFCALLRLLMFQERGELPMFLYDQVPAAKLLVPAILALVLLLLLSSVRRYQDILRLQKERNAAAVLEKQLDAMRAHIGELEHVYSGIRGLRHDMKNTVTVMLALAGKSELAAYAEEWNKSLAALEFRFCTGNAAADALLDGKQRELDRMLPGLLISADELLFPKDLLISGYDLGVILGNALDNAAEACQRLRVKEPEAEVFLRLRSVVRGKMLLLEAENSFDGQLVRRNSSDLPASGKADAGLHGIGLMNIRATAEKYHGTVEWTAEDRKFVLTVLMKNERSEENGNS